jgi:hypothetical protein
MALKGLWRRTTVLDRLVVAALLGGTLLSFMLLDRLGTGRRVVVERAGEVVFTAPLDVARTVRLDGPLGETVLEIRDGHACIRESPCPHKVCMGMGEVARRGELIACVPNRLIVRIEGGIENQEPGYDLLSR